MHIATEPGTALVALANPGDYSRVGEFVHALLCELYPEQASDFLPETYALAAKELLAPQDRVWAFLARIHGLPVGVITLNECAAVYAGGAFGEITELYVLPAHRSQQTGGALLQAADQFARQRGWAGLEVGTPAIPLWNRTLNFYMRHGFTTIGPRLERSIAKDIDLTAIGQDA